MVLLNSHLIRILITIVLLVFVWRGEDWALYLAVTLLTIGNEILTVVLANKLTKRKK